MGRMHLERLFSGLEAGFSAVIAAEEDVAADDLAFSLSQDLLVSDDLVRSGGSVVIDGAVVPIEVVGHDFLAAGPWLVPLDRAVVELTGASSAERTHDVLLGVLRRLARAGSVVSIGCGGDVHAGRVVRASASHVVVDAVRMVAVPLERVDYVRLARGGSADAL